MQLQKFVNTDQLAKVKQGGNSHKNKLELKKQTRNQETFTKASEVQIIWKPHGHCYY